MVNGNISFGENFLKTKVQKNQHQQSHCGKSLVGVKETNYYLQTKF